MRHVKRIFHELRRKGIHFSGSIIPFLYYLGLKLPAPGTRDRLLTQESATLILGVLTALYLVFEGLRFVNPTMNRFFIRRFGFLMRQSEYRRLTGAGYYFLGAFLAVWLFRPGIAIAALLFLIFGDFAAALVGTAIGKIRVFARKSLEGSLACFIICYGLGLALFWKVAPDWSIGARIALSGAIAATLAELLPLRVNDNLTIPLLSGLAMLLSALAMGIAEVPLP